VSLPLLALFLATFGIATTEFAVVGLLPEIAVDFGVSIPKAGLLVSGYALGVAVGGPILVILTAPLSRKVALLLLIGVFVVGHVFSAVAPTYGMLMAARIVAAVCHASFMGIAAVVAAGTAPPNRSARAVAMVWLGFSAASLFGVPAAAALGHAMGWRSTFWAIAAVGAFAGLAIAAWIPQTGRAGRTNLAGELRALGRGQVLLSMATSLLVCAVTFSVFTYIAPLLATETGISAEALPGMLFLFGIGGTAGLLAGGRLADWRPMPSIIFMFVAQAALYLTLIWVIRSPVRTGAAILAWGFLFLAPCVPLQTRVVKQASEGPNLASTLNQSAFNIGNALGPSIGPPLCRSASLTNGCLCSGPCWRSWGRARPPSRSPWSVATIRRTCALSLQNKASAVTAMARTTKDVTGPPYVLHNLRSHDEADRRFL
jgi:DHA1 family inner membrane transport protein